MLQELCKETGPGALEFKSKMDLCIWINPLTLAEAFDCRTGAGRACPHKRQWDSVPFRLISSFDLLFSKLLVAVGVASEKGIFRALSKNYRKQFKGSKKLMSSC